MPVKPEFVDIGQSVSAIGEMIGTLMGGQINVIIDQPEYPCAAKVAAWRDPGAILCIAGRGPLDEAAAEILGQLLQKHGLGARVVPHGAASRAEIEGLDLVGVAMVRIAYLEVEGSPSHLRYLLQRLRERLKTQKLLVGLWSPRDGVLTQGGTRQEIGADFYVTSLREAVEVCVAEAAPKLLPLAQGHIEPV